MKFSAFGDLKSGSHTWIHNNCFASVFFVFLQFLEPPASSGFKKKYQKNASPHPSMAQHTQKNTNVGWVTMKRTQKRSRYLVENLLIPFFLLPHIGENIIPINQGQLDIAQLVPLPWNLPLCSTSSSVLDGSHRGHVQNCTPGKFGFQQTGGNNHHGRFLFWWFQVLGGSSQLVRLASG